MLVTSEKRDSSERLVRAYARTSRWREQAIAALNASFEGIWLGLLDREALARLDESFYNDVRESVDGDKHSYVDHEWNAQGLKDWEAAAIDAHFPKTGRVVVTGAGGGREVFELLRRGFDATGYEPHPRLVEAGDSFMASHGHPHRLALCERDVFPTDAGSCDAIVVGWGSYMLIPSAARRIAFLRAARTRLHAGAPILLSFFLRREGLRYLTVLTATANAVRRLRCKEGIDLGDALSPTYVHYFTRNDVEAELNAAGFRMVMFEANPYGHAVAVAG